MGNKIQYNMQYHDDSGVCYYFDTDDPYSLRAEAQAARDMLADHYVQGMEFADIRRSGDELAFRDAMARKAQGIPTAVCSVGAVYYVQGHHSYACNLIRSLDKKAAELFGDSCHDPSCNDDDCPGTIDNIIIVNDRMGLDAALTVFDAVIAEYTQEVMRAEWMAEDYQPVDLPRPARHFAYTKSTPVNYGPDKSTTPSPVVSKVTV